MFIAVGLGNPDQKYKNTRHNIGSEILENFQKENGFPSFGISKKLNSSISKETIKDKEIILAQPQIFMNKSGEAVKSLINYYRLKIANLIIIHDDIDLPLGKIKISKDRGSAGHKGVESIIKELKTKEFIRLRVGIQPQKGKPRNPQKFVLKKFTRKENSPQIAKEASQALKVILIEGIETAMNKFN